MQIVQGSVNAGYIGLKEIVLAAVACLVMQHVQADGSDIHWGAGGHVDYASYGKVSIQQQMQLLRKTGMSWYRTSCLPTNCAQLIDAAKQNGVTILKAIGCRPDADLTEEQNYSKAFACGKTEASAYGGGFQYFEASNELDNWVQLKGDGSDRSQYKADRYTKARGTIKGLIDGVHAVNSSAQVAVDDAGWCHYGFLQMLWGDGVRWDITAFHWYSDQGDMERAGCKAANVASMHASFGRPVWITEFNSNIAAKSADALQAAIWNEKFIQQIHQTAAKYQIQAAFVYELLDESNLHDLEGHFGIYAADGSDKATSTGIAKALAQIAHLTPDAPQQLKVR